MNMRSYLFFFAGERVWREPLRETRVVRRIREREDQNMLEDAREMKHLAHRVEERVCVCSSGKKSTGRGSPSNPR